VGSNSEIQGYNFYPMLYFHRKFSSSITMDIVLSPAKSTRMQDLYLARYLLPY